MCQVKTFYTNTPVPENINGCIYIHIYKCTGYDTFFVFIFDRRARMVSEKYCSIFKDRVSYGKNMQN